MKLVLVNKKIESKKVKSFYFTPIQKFKFKAGQYIYLDLSPLKYQDQKGQTRQFTISNCPGNKYIRITTNISGSGFKRTLENLGIGSVVNARGPFGHLVFDKKKDLKKKNIFLAGGIGITPFLSIIQDMACKKMSPDILLIYSNTGNDFIFKNELEIYKFKNSNLRIEYVNTKIVGRIDKTGLDKLLKKHNFNQDLKFWVVGPPGFVNNMEDIMNDFDVVSEKFIGY